MKKARHNDQARRAPLKEQSNGTTSAAAIVFECMFAPTVEAFKADGVKICALALAVLALSFATPLFALALIEMGVSFG